MLRLLCLFFFFNFFICSLPADQEKHYVQIDNIVKLKKYLQYSKALISAHRGGPMVGYPENAIETFENALTFAPCIIECDVAKSADGQLVLMHDDKLDRTTTGKGFVNKYTVKELKSLYLKDNENNITKFRIPTFREVLKWAKGKAILSVDVKRGIKPEEIVKIINEENAGAYSFIIVYNIGKLKEYYKLNPQLLFSISGRSKKSVKQILATKIPAENLLVFVGLSEPRKEVYELLHSKGMRAILGTMHNLDNKARNKGIHVYQKLIKNGADILATDNVPLTAEAIKNLK